MKKSTSGAAGNEQKPLNQADSPYQGSDAGQREYYNMREQKKGNENGGGMAAPAEMYQQPNEVQGHERYEMPGSGEMGPRELDGRAVDR